MSGGSEQHRLEFAPSDRFHVFVRLLPQARQALLQAYSSQQPCSLQYSTDGAPHVRTDVFCRIGKLIKRARGG